MGKKFISTSDVSLKARAAAPDFALPYPSQRVPVLGRQMVATSQPLAAQAGLAVLAAGGNAIDAAIATAAALTVVEPNMNGLGSDVFALVWDGSRCTGSTARAARRPASPSARFRGRRKVPALGWDAVTVPGAVHAWGTLWRRFGSRPFASLLAPAIAYARDGFLVAPVSAALWQEQAPRYRRFREFSRVFLPGGEAPAPGSCFATPISPPRWRSWPPPRGAASTTARWPRASPPPPRASGGAARRRDLDGHRSVWVEPLSLPFGDVVVHELPPNGQGLASLVALGILARLGITELPVDGADAIHLQVEAMKLAFGACRRHVADPEAMMLDPARLLEDDYLAATRASNQPNHGAPARTARRRPSTAPSTWPPPTGPGAWCRSFSRTTSASARAWWSPARGSRCRTGPSASRWIRATPTASAGGKRPYHTIMPGFVTGAGRRGGASGVMGGHMQPQGHVQMVLRLFAHRQNPQAACDAPRWHVTETSQVALEPGFGPEVAQALSTRGHELLPRPRRSFLAARRSFSGSARHSGVARTRARTARPSAY